MVDVSRWICRSVNQEAKGGKHSQGQHQARKREQQQVREIEVLIDMFFSRIP